MKLGKYGSNQEAATVGSSLMRLFAKMEVLGYRTNTDTRGIGNSTQEHSEKVARGRTKTGFANKLMKNELIHI